MNRPKPETADAPGRRAVRLAEPLEDMRKEGRLDAGAGVGDAHFGGVPGGCRVDGNPAVAAA